MELKDFDFKKKDLKKLMTRNYMALAVTLIAVVVISYALIQGVGLAGDILQQIPKALSWVSAIVSPLLIGFVFAYLLMPLVKLLERPLSRTQRFGEGGKNPRGLAVLGTYLILLVVLTLLFSLIISSITNTLKVADFGDIETIVNAFSEKLNGIYDFAMKMVDKFDISSGKLAEALRNMIGKLAGIFQNAGVNFISGMGGLGSSVTNIMFGFIFSIYFLLESEKLMEYWQRAFRLIFGDSISNKCGMLLRDADRCFAGYIKGQFLDALFLAVVVSILLLVLGVDYAIIIGVLTGIGNLIPYVGAFVAYLLTVGVCLMQGDWKLLIMAVIGIAILQAIEGNIVNPKLMSANMEIHPVLVIIGLIVGGAVGGLIGMIIAVPVAGFVKIQFERILRWIELRRGHKEEQKNTPEQGSDA